MYDISSIAPAKEASPYADLTVEVDADFKRVTSLPERDWQTDPNLESTRLALTAWLKTETGTMELNLPQTAALCDAYNCRGLVGPLLPGSGKTLVAFLVGRVLGASLITIVVPGSMHHKDPKKSKTIQDHRRYAQHFVIPHYTLLTYEKLGRAEGLNTLYNVQPQVIVLDEAHRARSHKAGCNRALDAFLKKFPNTIVIAISASIGGRGVKDSWWLTRKALKHGAPVPLGFKPYLAWHRAIDEKVRDGQRIPVGPLVRLVKDAEGETDLDIAQDAYGKRYSRTPGVVASVGDRPATAINIEVRKLPISAQVLEILRDVSKAGVTPDGDLLEGPLAVYRFGRQLEQGFYYRLDPPPPSDWWMAKQAWNLYARPIIRDSRKLFTLGAVAQAIDRGELPDGSAILATWRALRNNYDPEQHKIPVWIDYTALNAAYTYAASEEKTHGIIWCDHVEIGKRLEGVGIPYFGPGGLDIRGRSIVDCRTTCAASIKANGTGRDRLQYHYVSNYYVGFSTVGAEAEQLLGRTHRQGQSADEVSNVIPYMTSSKLNAIQSAIDDAIGAQLRDRVPQKLCYATWLGDLDELVIPGVAKAYV